jgi:hypothetical protein
MPKFRFRLRDRTFNERFDARAFSVPSHQYGRVERGRLPFPAAVRITTMRKMSRNSHCSTRSERLTDWLLSSCRPPVGGIDGVSSGLREK